MGEPIALKGARWVRERVLEDPEGLEGLWVLSSFFG
jgi:hypothetical protein